MIDAAQQRNESNPNYNSIDLRLEKGPFFLASVFAVVSFE